MRNTIMQAKKMLGTIACAVAAVALASPAEARINERQHTQQSRIYSGVKSGALTRHEAIGLSRQQARIARYENRSRKDGRGLTAVERARIEHKQDHASRAIYRQKHDRQSR